MTNAGNMEEIWKEFEAASVKNQTKVNAQQRKFPGEVKPAGKLDFELETFRKSIEKCTLPEIKDILTRQDAILSNSKLMSTLPDKGLKVQLKKKKVEELIESRTKAIDEASELLSGLKLIDTNSLEFRLGGAMYKHLNIPDEQTKEKTDSTNVFGILASKEVPDKASLENYSIELAQKLDARKNPTDDLASAPFKQLKRSELDDKSKGKITLKRREDRTDIKTRQREVMPLPPSNYNGLKVQEINLTESMEIQKQQEHRVKDARIQNALDKLLVPGTSKKVNFEEVSPDMRYRENTEEEDEFEEEEKSHPHSYSMEPQDSDDDDD